MVSTIFLLWICLILCSSSEYLPTSYLVATNGGITIYSPDNSSSSITYSLPIIASDFRFAQQDFYFISKNNIFYSYYSQYSKGYSEPIRIMEFPHSLSDVVFDWVHYRIYVSSMEVGVVYEAAILGSSHIIKTTVDNVQCLAIDPYNRQLFFLSNGQLGSLDLRSNLTTRHSSTGAIVSAAMMAVDHHEATIYVVGLYELGSWVLVASDYSGTQNKEVFRGPQLGRPVALDAFNFRVVWCSDNGCFELNSSQCTQSNQCDVRQLSFATGQEVIHDIRFYNSLVQTPSPELACSKLNCSHNCSMVSLYTVVCTCPTDMVVDPGGNMCRERPRIPKIEELFFDRLKEEVYQWAAGLALHARVFILACCGLMLVLLVCGMCVLRWVPSKEFSRRRNDSYNLAEISSYSLHQRLAR